MKKNIFVISLICLSMVTHAEAFPVFGVDSVGGDFFNQWYLTTDLGHYLDNYSDYVVYEAETTGEWNTGDMNIFSIAGNSFRQNKYYYNGMRVNPVHYFFMELGVDEYQRILEIARSGMQSFD